MLKLYTFTLTRKSKSFRLKGGLVQQRIKKIAGFCQFKKIR